MKAADTISVNPSKTALGHVDSSNTSIFRSPVIMREETTHELNLVKILFPTIGAGTSEYKKYAVPLRTLFATILIVTGLSLLISPMAIHGIGFAICTICFGSFLAIGFFTRPIMMGAAVYYCITGALALRTGNADVSVFSLMFGCLVFAVLGAGKYSCDTLFLNLYNKLRKAVSRKKKTKELGYKAFHKVNY